MSRLYLFIIHLQQRLVVDRLSTKSTVNSFKCFMIHAALFCDWKQESNVLFLLFCPLWCEQIQFITRPISRMTLQPKQSQQLNCLALIIWQQKEKIQLRTSSIIAFQEEQIFAASEKDVIDWIIGNYNGKASHILIKSWE